MTSRGPKKRKRDRKETMVAKGKPESLTGERKAGDNPGNATEKTREKGSLNGTMRRAKSPGKQMRLGAHS